MEQFPVPLCSVPLFQRIRGAGQVVAHTQFFSKSLQKSCFPNTQLSLQAKRDGHAIERLCQTFSCKSGYFGIREPNGGSIRH
jgi:hypothetical protein